MVYRGFLALAAMAAVALVSIAPPAGVRIAWGQEAANAGKGKTERGDENKPGVRSGEARPEGARQGRRGRRGGRGPALVEIDAVTRGPVVETVPVYGRVVTTQSGIVAARTKGAVAKVAVKVGDRVAEGDTLVTLAVNMLRSERALKAAEMAEFKAKVRTTQIQLKLAEQELQRLERLQRSAAFSRARFQDKQRDVERMKSVIGEAQAKVDQARAELAMADINLANAVIRAPFAGVVSERHVEKGAYLSVGQKVVTLVNDQALEVEAEVPAQRIPGLEKNMRVSVHPEIGKPFDAFVRAKLPIENSLARTRTVRFAPEANGAAHLLATNQSVIVGVPSGPSRIALSVHKDAVVYREGRPIVFVFDKGRAVLREVKLGDAFGLRFETLAGLTAGEMVVIRGNERLRDGQRLRTRGDRE